MSNAIRDQQERAIEKLTTELKQAKDGLLVSKETNNTLSKQVCTLTSLAHSLPLYSSLLYLPPPSSISISPDLLYPFITVEVVLRAKLVGGRNKHTLGSLYTIHLSFTLPPPFLIRLCREIHYVLVFLN